MKLALCFLFMFTGCEVTIVPLKPKSVVVVHDSNVSVKRVRHTSRNTITPPPDPRMYDIYRKTLDR